MTQKQVVHLMMTALTREELEQARMARDEWLRNHSLADSGAVAEAGSRFNRIDEAVREVEKSGSKVERLHPKSPTISDAALA